MYNRKSFVIRIERDLKYEKKLKKAISSVKY